MKCFLLLFALTAASVRAADGPVDIDSAAQLYDAAQVRQQVRAALPGMPDQIRQLFSRDPTSPLSETQLTLVRKAAERGFRIDVFETAALVAFAHNLDADTLARTRQFLGTDVGRRMVEADVAAAELGTANIDKVMNGQTPVTLSSKRAALIERIAQDTRAAASNVQIYLAMAQAVAVGTAIGSGQDPNAVAARTHKPSDAERAGMEQEMQAPMQRFLGYSYRNLSDADLKRLGAFLESAAGRHYVAAYNAAMQAGYEAMGRRTGEQLGESLRELAQAELDDVPPARSPPEPASPEIPAPHETPMPHEGPVPHDAPGGTQGAPR